MVRDHPWPSPADQWVCGAGSVQVAIRSANRLLEELQKEELNAGKIPASVQDLAAENQKSSRKSSP